jgi:predicted membrane protein
LFALGTLWLLDLIGVLAVEAEVVIPSLLVAVGVALVLGARSGPHGWLITVGVLLTVATLFSAVAPTEALRGGIGERMHDVASVGDLESQYDLGIGEFTLDLRDLSLETGRTVVVAVGAGGLTVLVPEDLEVRIDATVSAGEIDLFDERADGLSVERSYESPGYDVEGGLLLDLSVGAGRIEVAR